MLEIMGMWLFCDGLYSLLIYTKKEGQSWWRDHSFRIVRMAIGVVMMILGIR